MRNKNNLNRVWVVTARNNLLGTPFKTRQLARNWRRTLKAGRRNSTRIVKFVRAS